MAVDAFLERVRLHDVFQSVDAWLRAGAFDRNRPGLGLEGLRKFGRVSLVAAKFVKVVERRHDVVRGRRVVGGDRSFHHAERVSGPCGLAREDARGQRCHGGSCRREKFPAAYVQPFWRDF